MTNEQILAALKEAFNDAYLRETGGGVICPCVPVGDNGAYALVTDDGENDRGGYLLLGYYDEDAEDFNPDDCIIAQGEPMEAVLVKLFALRARFEIWGDFETFGDDVTTFAELQDKCDANMYLERALVYYQKRFPQTADAALPFLNAIIETLDSEAFRTFV